MRSTAVRTVAAPPDQVWGVLADHEGMRTWVPGLRVAVTRPGTSETGGVGTVRKVGFGIAGPIVEEVVAFEPGRRLGYRALAGVPLKDYRGEVVLSPAGAGTEIRYTVEAEQRLPFGEALLVRGLAAGLLSGLVRGVRAGGVR
ncbi:SRPBCC family protein [Pseudonocardia broussonetiae]|uniref:SRPBCC family protein n=1 Tax=Pseudonocardia broussonetiae TaxID=2736640 RepID=A0A6M6JSK6_9PSEU|nr:SRPBCC family protein [Pseudonocardia broussonetiae]